MEIQNLIGSTLKKAPAQDYIESFKFLIRGGFLKISDDNSIVLSTTAIKSMEKLMQKISANFGDYQPLKIYSSNQIQIAFEYLNSEIQSYRQLPSKSRFISFKTNANFSLKQGLLYSNISEILNFMTILNSIQSKDELAKSISKIVKETFKLLDLDVKEFISFNAYSQFSSNSENRELALLFDNGKEQYVLCKKCKYQSRREVAVYSKEVIIDEELEAITEVNTPGTDTIASLANLLEIEESKCAKVVLYCYKISNKSKIAVIITRGDMEVSKDKLKNVLKTDSLEFASESEIASIKAVPGYASAIGINRKNSTLIVDDIIPRSTNLVAGANKLDYHLLNTNYGRDYEADIVTDITLANEGDKCRNCNSKLKFESGIPLYYSSLIRNSKIVDFLDNKGKPQKTDILISCFDITRMFGTISLAKDKFGVILPTDLSPFQFVLITIGDNDDITELSNDLYVNLKDKFDILHDNRKVKFGVKLADADLRSIPFRIIISQTTIENNKIEFSIRGEKEKEFYQIDELEDQMRNILFNNLS